MGVRPARLLQWLLEVEFHRSQIGPQQCEIVRKETGKDLGCGIQNDWGTWLLPLSGARAPFVSQPSAPEMLQADRLLYSAIKATYYKSKVAENNCPIWYNYLELVG